VVRGRSMRPTLAEGDRLLVWHGGVPRAGGLAVVRLPATLAGVARQERVVAVKRVARRDGDAGWWVERDSPTEGVDSWAVGAVPDDDVLAIVLCRLWPRPWRRVSPPPHA